MPFSKLKTPVPESGATGITTKQNMQFQIDGKHAFHCIGPPPGQRHYYCRWRTGSGAWPEQLHISPSDDWFGPGHLQNWEPLLSMHAGKKLPLRRCKCCPMRPEPGPDAQPVAALELGSWEGNSTAWIASHMCWHKDSVLVAVDDWSWANQFSEDEETKARRIADLAQVEQRFDANILAASEAEGGCGKVIKRKGNTQTVLPELQKEDLRFDFCYIDASHAPEDVLRDAVLAWPLVKSGGIIIFDDYGKHDYESETCPIAYQSQMENKPSYCSTHGWFGPAMDPAWNGPPGCRCTGRGVDAFLACYGKFCKVIDCKYQIALLKL